MGFGTFLRRLSGARAPSAGEVLSTELAKQSAARATDIYGLVKPYIPEYERRARGFADITSSRMQDLSDFLKGSGSAPWISGLVGELGEGSAAEREGALEGGLRGGQLSRFLAEQPFRRRQKQSALLSGLLGTTTAQHGNALQTYANLGPLTTSLLSPVTGSSSTAAGAAGVAAQAGEQRIGRETELMSSLMGGIGQVGGTLFGSKPGNLFSKLFSRGSSSTTSDTPYPNFLGGFPGGQFKF